MVMKLLRYPYCGFVLSLLLVGTTVNSCPNIFAFGASGAKLEAGRIIGAEITMVPLLPGMKNT